MINVMKHVYIQLLSPVGQGLGPSSPYIQVICSFPVFLTKNMTTICKILALQDTALAPAVQEQQDIISKHGSQLSMDVLADMEILHRNITEALRMHPPLILVMRYAKQPFTVTTSKGQTYTVPQVRVLGVRVLGSRVYL
jgi:hypothetical protein